LKTLWRKYNLWLAKRRLARAAKLIEEVAFEIMIDDQFCFERRMEFINTAERLRVDVQQLADTIR
jgi:hypothetical protein